MATVAYDSLAAVAQHIAVVLKGLYGAKLPNVNSYCSFELTLGYSQCLAWWGQDKMVCELQSPRAWRVLAPLFTPERIETLKSLGFAPPERATPNYWQVFTIDSPAMFERIADLLVRGMVEVYGLAPGMEVTTRCTLPGLVN